MNLSRFAFKVFSLRSPEKAKFNPSTITQLLMVSIQCLWIYDYILTLGDEVRRSSIFWSGYPVLTVAQIKYAWHGRRSWSEPTSLIQISYNSYGCSTVFALFIAVRHPEIPELVTGLTVLQNRYTPVLHLIWVHTTMFHYKKPVSLCPRRHRDTRLTSPPAVVRLRPRCRPLPYLIV